MSTFNFNNTSSSPSSYYNNKQQQQQQQQQTQSTSNSFSERLKRFDQQTSIPSEYRVYTSLGAILSLTTLLLITYLIYTEYNYNFTPTTLEKVHVNATTSKGLEMEFDITFPKIPCALLSISAEDPTGQQQSLHIDTKHRLWKHRLTKDGELIGHRSKIELGNTLQSEGHVEEYATNRKIQFVKDKQQQLQRQAQPGEENYYDDDEVVCGSCYGAGEDGECCNTCDDVKNAYIRKGWAFTPNMDVKQCRTAVNSHEMEGEGCNVHGIVALSSGGGNLHIAPSHQLENFGKTFAFQDLTELVEQAFETFNVSHTMNKLRFGQPYPGDIHQLDGQERMIEDAYGMYQYYVQVVPTQYKFLNGTSIETNQYSAIEHMRHVTPNAGRGLPGVYFFYEVSALHVEMEEYYHGWIKFLTSISAIVGGVFSAMKMTDAYGFSKMKNAILSPRL